MPYYIISVDNQEVYCCQCGNRKSAEEEATRILDTHDDEIQEISANQAEIWCQKWWGSKLEAKYIGIIHKPRKEK